MAKIKSMKKKKKRKPPFNSPVKPRKRVPSEMLTADPELGRIYTTIRDGDEIEARAQLLTAVEWAKDLGEADARLAIEYQMKDLFRRVQEMLATSFQNEKMTQELYAWLSADFMPSLIEGPLLRAVQPQPKTQAVKDALEQAQREIANANNNDTARDSQVTEGGATPAGIAVGVTEEEANRD